MEKMPKEAWQRFVQSAEGAVREVGGEGTEFAQWLNLFVDERVSALDKHLQTPGQKKLDKEKALVKIVGGFISFPESAPETYKALADTLKTAFEEKLESSLYPYGDVGWKNSLPETVGDFANASPIKKVEGFLGNVIGLFSGK